MSGLGGLEAGPRERAAVWRANPKTEPCGLGLGWTCRGGVREGRGGLCGAGDGQVSRLGGLEAGPRKRAAVWRANPKTEPCGLGFGWTCRAGVREGQGGFCGVGNNRVAGLGACRPLCTGKGGLVGYFLNQSVIHYKRTYSRRTCCYPLFPTSTLPYTTSNPLFRRLYTYVQGRAYVATVLEGARLA